MKKPAIIQLLHETLQGHGHPITAFVDGASLSNDLGSDSLDAINLVMALEEECNIEICDEDVDLVFGPAATVGSVVSYIEDRTGA